MTFVEKYWNQIDCRYNDNANRELHLMLENIYGHFNESRATEYDDECAENKEIDKKICNLLPKLHSDCEKYDSYEKAMRIKDIEADFPDNNEYHNYRSSGDVRNRTDAGLRKIFWKIMRLMDRRGWKNPETMDKPMAWLVLYLYFPKREHGNYGRNYDGSETDSIRKYADNAKALLDKACKGTIKNVIERDRIVKAAQVFDKMYQDSTENL